MKKMTLQEVCRETGVTRRAIQGYEKAGLVSPIGKNKYGYLLYDERGIEQICHVRFLQQIGFTIKEISELTHMSTDRKKILLIRQVQKLRSRHDELKLLIEKAEKYIETL